MAENLMPEETLAGLLAFEKEALGLKEIQPGMYAPLVLAYIGDAVYEVLIRTKIVNHGSMQVSKMHKASSQLVRAEAQAKLIHLIEEDLTEEERMIYKRGRNAHSATSAKNASTTDYRTATGFEALIGFLYLSDRYRRILELVSLGLARLEAEKNNG